MGDQIFGERGGRERGKREEQGGKEGEKEEEGQRKSEGGRERDEGGREKREGQGEPISTGERVRVCAYTCDLAYLLLCIYMYVHVHTRINNEIPI